MGTQLSAEIIGYAAKFDEQLSVPQRPVVRRGVTLETQEDGELLLGVVKPQLLNGQFAKIHLRSLFGLCDGSRDLHELAELTGIPLDSVFKAVAFLWTCGAVEEGARRETGAALPEALAVRMSRLGDSTGVHSHWTQAVSQLKMAKVHVAGDPRLAAELEHLIEKTEIRCRGIHVSDSDLVVLIETGPAAESDKIVAICWTHGIPLLRVGLSSQKLVVGPYVDPTFTPCLECSETDLTRVETSRNDRASNQKERLALGLAAHQVFAIVSRTIPSHLPTDIQITDLENLTIRHVSPATRAGCPQCGSALGTVAPEACLAAVYEQSVAIPPRQFVDAKGHQIHYQSSSLELQHEFRSYPSCPTYQLPEARMEPSSFSRELTLTHVATILQYCVGLRPQGAQKGKVRRWTAAGGNIGSVIAHVIIRNPSIAPPGTYVYLEHDHLLARLSHDTPGPDGEVLLVFNGDIAKVSRKYGSFSLRICIQDAGCSALVERQVAEEIGICARPIALWDDDVFSRSFGTSPSFQPITSVLSLGGFECVPTPIS